MKKFCLAIALIVSLAGNFAVPQALAMPNTPVIIANCRAAQQTINQIERADAVSRVNRGRAYNDVLDLFFAMNARLANNRIAALHLTELTSNFETQLADFRAIYNLYDAELSRAVNVDCVQKPLDFYNRLTKAREYRQELVNQIQKIDQTINDYRQELDKIVGDSK